MESFGKYLREERERKGIGIDEISRVTKIGPGQLKSLESDDFGALPPIAFVKGFVKAYAQYVNIDSEEAIIRLEQYLAEIDQEEEDTFGGETDTVQFRRASPDPRILITAIVVFVSIIILVMILAIRSCSAPQGALKKVGPEEIQTVDYAKMYMDALPALLTQTETSKSPLPTVPPQSFRVLRVDTPSYSVKNEMERPPAESDGYPPGGGSSSQ